MAKAYVPDRGDIVWVRFTPQAGHEQAGHRPAVVISPAAYNRLLGLALVCPITSRAKGYPFEVALPAGTAVTGVVLADQVKSLDWRERRADLLCQLDSRRVRIGPFDQPQQALGTRITIGIQLMSETGNPFASPQSPSSRSRWESVHRAVPPSSSAPARGAIRPEPSRSSAPTTSTRPCSTPSSSAAISWPAARTR